jgi:hypothetical protein
MDPNRVIPDLPNMHANYAFAKYAVPKAADFDVWSLSGKDTEHMEQHAPATSRGRSPAQQRPS